MSATKMISTDEGFWFCKGSRDLETEVYFRPVAISKKIWPNEKDKYCRSVFEKRCGGGGVMAMQKVDPYLYDGVRACSKMRRGKENLDAYMSDLQAKLDRARKQACLYLIACAEKEAEFYREMIRLKYDKV